MASIKISNLQPAGSEFFSDFESFLDTLSESELSNTNGGFTPLGYVVVMTVKVSTGYFAAGAVVGAVGASIAATN